MGSSDYRERPARWTGEYDVGAKKARKQKPLGKFFKLRAENGRSNHCARDLEISVWNLEAISLSMNSRK